MLQRSLSRLKIFSHFVAIIRDTSRTDRVFELVEAVARDPEFSAKYPNVEATEAFLAEPFQQGFPDLDALHSMPEGSLGHALAKHMDELGVDFSEFDRRPAPSSEYEWIDCHAYETHDIWHVLTGWGTGAANELGLQAFYQAQLRNIQSATLLLLGMVRGYLGGHEDFQALLTVVQAGFAQGQRSQPLFGVDWRPQFERPLSEVRADFELEPVRAQTFDEIEERLAA